MWTFMYVCSNKSCMYLQSLSQNYFTDQPTNCEIVNQECWYNHPPFLYNKNMGNGYDNLKTCYQHLIQL
jgi:hypothetical protein